MAERSTSLEQPAREREQPRGVRCGCQPGAVSTGLGRTEVSGSLWLVLPVLWASCLLRTRLLCFWAPPDSKDCLCQHTDTGKSTKLEKLLA